MSKQSSSVLPVVILFACFLVGVAGLWFFFVESEQFSGDPIAAAIALVASALAFGQAANAIFVSKSRLRV